MQKVDCFLATVVFGGAGIEEQLDDDVTVNPEEEWDDELDQLLTRFFEQSQLENALTKGPMFDLGWDEQLTPSPRVFSEVFERASAARVEKVNRLVRKAFAGHPELAEEAVKVVTQIRNYARASVTGDAVQEEGDAWWKEGELVRTTTKFAKGTNAFRMGVARTEERIINNVRWLIAYNANGDMIDSQQINEQERVTAQIA